jgi:hypothetical protein
MSQYKLAVQGVEGSQAIPGLVHQCVANEPLRTYLGEQTVRDYRNRFLVKYLASLTYKRPPGRPSKLTKTQRRELAESLNLSLFVGGQSGQST